jgi:hypothetical protein
MFEQCLEVQGGERVGFDPLLLQNLAEDVRQQTKLENDVPRLQHFSMGVFIMDLSLHCILNTTRSHSLFLGY